MDKIEVTPYLFFKSNCREAMEFYKGVFGGELIIQTYGDVGVDVPGNDKDHVIHARLEGGDAILMASDTAQASAEAAKVTISLMDNNEKKLRKIFDALCEDTEPETPIRKEFWGDLFGSVTDKFGISWMVTISAKN